MTGKPLVLIISPARANANNGNWQTAARWAEFLGKVCEIRIAQDWDGEPADAMIALHARRSAPAIHAWAAHCPDQPLVLVLTGTDLYRDIGQDEAARRSLELAQHLVLLQEDGLNELPAHLRGKSRVIYQSAPAWNGIAEKPPEGVFRTIMVGHLRSEKMPATYMAAARLLAAPGNASSNVTGNDERLQMLHVGSALEPELAEQARATEEACPHYRWLGGLPHDRTRALLAGSDLMVISSAMEGGAHVIIEAINSGVPVLASDIAGNRGMLGGDYSGYFPLGDASALARMITRFRSDPAWREQLRAQGQARAPLFAPATERAALLDLLDNALARA